MIGASDRSLDRDGLQDHRLRSPRKGRRILTDSPDLVLEKAQELLGLASGVEVEVDHHVVRVVNRSLNALGSDARLAPGLGKAVERRDPVSEVGDVVLDVQRWHRLLPSMRRWTVQGPS